MNKKNEVIQAIENSGLIAIVRVKEEINLIPVVQAIAKGGISIIEITTNTPGYLQAIEEISIAFPDIIIGAGTITKAKQALDAIKAGANFLVTPVTSKAIIKKASAHEVPVIMGAYSPTEVHKAHQWGADFIKLFPANELGPSYLKSIQSTLPETVRFVPTGGINIQNWNNWMIPGVAALGLGSAICNPQQILTGNLSGLTASAQNYSVLMARFKEQNHGL